MNFNQVKLTKREWESLEKPVDENEMFIIKMIYNSNKNLNIIENHTKSLITFMTISDRFDGFHDHFYELYFKKKIDKFIKRNKLQSLNFQYTKTSKLKLKKADTIRIKNNDKKIKERKKFIFEYVLLSFLTNYFKHPEKKLYYFYTIKKILQNKIQNVNIHLLKFISLLFEKFEKKIKNKKIIEQSQRIIEKNKEVLKYSDYKLYDHQKNLFNTFNENIGSKFVLYQAPTGTGKTLSPIGLLKNNKGEKKRIIFVCAAKHVGLQLAKCCISLEIPIAIAFGCKDPGDIRLHYFAAKDYKRHRRSGGICRVDNSVGDKVEIIISDVQSYLPSMNYMLAFNKADDLLWFWDEPTISLDYKTHEFHDIIRNNWQNNEISNIVLSSATLPGSEDIQPVIEFYKNKFIDKIYDEGAIQFITSYECHKTISLINKEGYCVLPHIVLETKEDIQKSIFEINKNKTILRYMDIYEISKFILYIENNFQSEICERLYVENYFKKSYDIDVLTIKMYYLELLEYIVEHTDIYSDVFQYFNANNEKYLDSTIKVTTEDAHTLTDGPTIYLTDDVNRYAEFYLKASKIPENELKILSLIIKKNEKYVEELEKTINSERELQEKLAENKKDKESSEDSTEFKILEKYRNKIEMLKTKIKKLELRSIYIPNSTQHMKKWVGEEKNNAFRSDINEKTVEEIVCLPVDDKWKILLLMGIGVFVEGIHKSYSDIMKNLAYEQKLYIIFASSDYIYGTNYQFCHSYLSKDFKNMSREKAIQAAGRVGRKNNLLNYTIRIRDDEVIHKLFLNNGDNPEIKNMNKLFS